MDAYLSDKKNLRKIVSLFFVFVFAYLFLIILFFGGIYIYTEKDIKNQVSLEQNYSNQKAGEVINESVSQIKSDVLFLVRQTELFYEFESSDFERHLNETFYQFSIAKGVYNQIRFIDTLGMEKIRVDLTNNEVEIISNDQLQNKSNRYYFNDILNYPHDSVYFSPMDLNIENDSIEIPFKPMIRIGSPVYSSTGKLLGILVVNYFGQKIIDKLRSQDKAGIGKELFLNEDGYYFIGQTTDDEWGFMFEEKKDKNFLLDFPEAGKIIFNNMAGSVDTDKGIFNYSTISFINEVAKASDKEIIKQLSAWKIVSFVSYDQYKVMLMKQVSNWLYSILGVSVIVIIILWFLSRNIVLKILAREMLIERNEKLSIANASKDKFFSIIAHDLKSPCASMLSLSEILAEGGVELSSEQLDSALKAFYSTAKNTSLLLDNLLDWARLQTNRMIPIQVVVELDNIFGEVFELLKKNAEQKEISMIDNTQKGIRIYADREMINTTIRNIVSNAVKFTPAGGWIKLYADVTKDRAGIKVQDNGVGMSGEKVATLFHVGKANSTLGTANETGTGLGLILCKEFIELNNGKLIVESEQGKGTTFRILLPLAKTENHT